MFILKETEQIRNFSAKISEKIHLAHNLKKNRKYYRTGEFTPG